MKLKMKMSVAILASLFIAATALSAKTAPAASTVPAPKTSAAPAAKTGSFSEGDLSKLSVIPAAFGPFQAKSSGIGVYRGRLMLTADDLKNPLFVVVRVQSDFAHRFGWLRVFANNKLVATEGGLKENRIVEDVAQVLKPGDIQIAIMGMAYPGTGVDFYLVSKDSVLSVLQNPALDSDKNQVAQVPAATTEVTAAPAAKPVIIRRVLPATEITAGQVLEIQGENFNNNASSNRVNLGQRTVAGKALRSGWLSVDLPNDMQSGTYQLSVGSGRSESKPQPLLVLGHPQVRSLSSPECAVASELAIEGDNFSESAHLVHVFFGSIPARILQSNKQRILVKVPDLTLNASYPVKVSIGRLASVENQSIKIVEPAAQQAQTGE